MLEGRNNSTVIFDFGDTLASTQPTYPDRIKIALRQLGHEFNDIEFYDAYHLADYKIFNDYITRGSINSKIYQNTLYEVLGNKLKIPTPGKEIKTKVNLEIKKINYKRVLIESAGEILEHLKSRGFKLGLISNNDGHTIDKCRELGIDSYFEAIVDSTTVGMFKPDKNIYLHTLSELNVVADEVLHIGDLYGADILGGLNSGLDVIWINHRKSENYNSLDIKQFNGLKEFLESL